MSRQEFLHDVYSAVQQVPEGKVTTYGHIARLIQFPRHARHVGNALNRLGFVPLPPFHSQNVPWQRIVASNGNISPRDNIESCYLQADLLREEGVIVAEPTIGPEFVGGGGGKVDLAVFGWFPDRLPSEEQDASP
ncbi:DNA binding methylated-DNA--cysteine S-methyltransferase [Basidiobolus meristosporus CBS 931.73]|uniref:DNA binding methylated-DNA--cysteine S-methyltransferase n=1 Tax=Basidiobolus meristosporus CBS 931.73 TaxID=1314790 RepID=A0A1Y1XKM0_9FUNG|nr:DNA binding methylated-DNA--cysteine S-methyltransferase [Basidiobolus meristosporus CBS 931.73]|eukprot:ORX86307.1 DNA binding methylated-DNA--cysteine S-methyltransferase [Basidiobolus meristosporus CBS 931.73]